LLALEIDPKPAALRSTAAAVARLKMRLPLPASLRTFLNVSSRFDPDWIASSSTPTLLLIAVASFSTCDLVTFAAPPVDFSAALV